MPLSAELGASAVHDYRTTVLSRTSQRFGAILDTVGAVRFTEGRPNLARDERFVPLEFGVREIARGFTTGWRADPKVITAVSGDNRSLPDDVVRSVETGQLRPVIGHRYVLDDMAEAHRYVEARYRTGSVVVRVR